MLYLEAIFSSVFCRQVPLIIRQAVLKHADARCGIDIACEPVQYRIPVIVAQRSLQSGRISWMSSSQYVTLGFTCARRDRQQQR